MNARTQFPNRPQHEGGDLRPKLILVIAGGVIAMVLLVALIATVLTRARPASAPTARASQLPPASSPPLESDPVAERAAFQHEKRSRLETYGWIDGRHDFAHVPIERAMQMLARQQGARTHSGAREDP